MKRANTAQSTTSVGAGKATAKYWENRVYRPKWTDEHSTSRQVSNYFARIMISGRREAVALNTSDRMEAARKAAKLYDRIRAVGWEPALRDFDPERHTKKATETIGDVIKAINSANLVRATKADYVNALRWFAARHVGFVATKKTFGPRKFFSVKCFSILN